MLVVLPEVGISWFVLFRNVLSRTDTLMIIHGNLCLAFNGVEEFSII